MKIIGIVLVLCWPLLIAWFGLHSLFTPKWYDSVAFIERNDATIDDMKRAFAEIQSKQAHVEFNSVTNTDLYAVRVRDLNAQSAADKANAIVNAIVQKLSDRKPEPPRAMGSAQLSERPMMTYPLLPNLAFGTVLGFFPAIVGLILMVLGRRRRSVAVAAPQIA